MRSSLSGQSFRILHDLAFAHGREQMLNRSDDGVEETQAEGDVASNGAKIADSSLSNVALSLVGVPKWLTSNLNCTLYALLLFGAIFAVWKFIEFGYTNWSSVSESGLVYRRKIQFLLSACMLFGVSAAVFDWCLLSPFIVVSAIVLLTCIILKR